VSKEAAAVNWRESRRLSARAAILDTAWAVVREEGLAALSLRNLARRTGITTPTVYAYFNSKNDIYDAMFGQAAEDFAAHMAAPYESDDPQEILIEGFRRFGEFCTADLARYQLLFQRTIPGFEPSAGSYAPAVRALDTSRSLLALNGITDERHLDIWTAITTGLVNQQISNDPGGQRWVRLMDDIVAMFLAYCRPRRPRLAQLKQSESKAKGVER
jgi:AcrR family transcriptional regulator